MKKGYLLILATFFFLAIPTGYAKVLSNQAAFCEHMNYSIEINATENVPYCIFDDGTKCTIDSFYQKSCGADKIKEISPRKDGERVYLEFESCEEGLSVSPPKYLLDTHHCYKQFSLIDFFKNFFWPT